MVLRKNLFVALALLSFLTVDGFGEEGGGMDVHCHLFPSSGGVFSKGDGGGASGGQGTRMGPRGQGQGQGRRSRMGPPPGRGKGPGRGRPSGASQGGNSPNDYAGAARTFVSAMDEARVHTALLMPPPRTSENNRDPQELDELLNAARLFPGRLFVAGGGCDLNVMIQETPTNQVTAQLKNQFRKMAMGIIAKGIKAFGEMASMHLSLNEKHVAELAPADHPLFLELADIAANHRMAIDLHTEAVPVDMPRPAGLNDKNPAVLPATIPGLERLLAHNRQAAIVWQHCGWDNTGGRTAELTGRLLAAHPNLFVALRVERRETMLDKVTPMPNRIVDANGKIKGEWMALFQRFPDRFVIGTDEFYNPSGGSPEHIQSFKPTWAILEQLPPPLRQKIAGENGHRIYGF